MNFHIEPLVRRHDRSAFDCGEPALNEFIQRHARQNQERRISRTYVAAEVGGIQVLGFYTITGTSLAATELPEAERRRLPRHRVPMVQIARLAVDRLAAGQGLGEALLFHALGRAALVAEVMGIYGVEVYAKHDRAAGFYHRFGFLRLEDDRLHLYLPMSTILDLPL